MKLISSAVCVDCEEVFSYQEKNGNSHCPCCGSHAWTPLAKYFKPLNEAVERIDKNILAKNEEILAQERGKQMIKDFEQKYGVS
jgi:hypothetical protein